MEEQLMNSKNQLEFRVRDLTTRAEEKNKSLSQELIEKRDKLFEANGLSKELQEKLKMLQDACELK